MLLKSLYNMCNDNRNKLKKCILNFFMYCSPSRRNPDFSLSPILIKISQSALCNEHLTFGLFWQNITVGGSCVQRLWPFGMVPS